ncbi:MAG: peptidylprolyl isomerase [Elusimicrobiota bacterium]|nr:peptidylprolyl isomerase [Elusimicrobiota bacterium]
MKKNNWHLILVALAITYSLAHCLYAAVVNKAIAKVNDDVILQSDYDEAVNPVISQIKKTYGEVMPQEDMDKKIAEIRKELLDQMIDQKLLLQEAKKKDVKVSKREVDDGIETVKDRFKRKNEKVLTAVEADAEFNSELKKQNLTMAKFRDKLREDIMVNKLIEDGVVRKVIPPSADELKSYYEKNRDKMDEPEKVSVRHILIRVEKNASTKEKSQALNKIKEVQQKLNKGEDFAKLAQQYSEDPGSQKNGGELGFIVRGMMVKNFEDTAFKTPVGEISDYFETEFGYHILKVDAKQAKQKRRFEDVKLNLEKYLLAEKRQEEYEKYIKELRDKSNISSDIK